MDTVLTDWWGEEETARLHGAVCVRRFLFPGREVEDFRLMLAPKRQDTRGFTV